MNMRIKLVHSDEAARETIHQFQREGYLLANIYVLAYDDERTDNLVHLTDTSKIGLLEEGVVTAFANLFRSRDEQLVAKMESLGIDKADAERYERELERGAILVMTWPPTEVGFADEELRNVIPAPIPPVGPGWTIPPGGVTNRY